MAFPALIVCLLFIAFLLRRDIKRRKTVSWAVWLPTIFLLIVGSRPLSMWFGQGGTWNGEGLANNAEGSPIDQIFFFSLIIGSLLIATARHVNWGRLFAANLPVFLFYLYFVLSVLWSEDPMGSAKRLFKDFGMIFVIGLLLSEKNPVEAIGALYVRCASVLFPLSAVCIRWFPAIARRFSKNGSVEYSGVTTQKNSLGEVVLVFGLFLIWDYFETLPRGKWRWRQFPWDRVLLLVMGVWLLHMCQSKTGLLCLVIGTVLMLRRGWFASRMLNRAVLIAALCLPCIVLFAQQFEFVLAPVVQAVGRNLTFTGRTDIWEHIDLHTVNPLIGFGYYNFWGGSGGQMVNEEMHMTIPNAHDGYLDIYLDGGAIGIALLASMLITYGGRFIRTFNRDLFHRLRFAIVIAAIVYNISESNWARLTPLWFTVVLALVYLPGLRAPQRVLQRARPAEVALP